MLSAGEDLSIVTWHPPTLNSGSQPSATLVATPDKDDLQKGNASPSSPFKKGSTGESDLKSPSREAGGGGRYHSTILHETDPGFVQHTAEVVGLAVLPGAVVSADLSGRILVRGPDRLIGKTNGSIAWVCPTVTDLSFNRARPCVSPAVLGQ